MEDKTNRPKAGLSVVWWTLGICLVVALWISYPFIVEVSRALADVSFLRGFAKYLLISALTGLLAGGTGLAVAKLISLNNQCAEAAIRFLRLFMWLPFFLLWALPIGPPTAMVGALPTVFLGACYYYLCSLYSIQRENGPTRYFAIRHVLIFSLFVCLLLQIYLSESWPWSIFATTFVKSGSLAALGVAALLLLAALTLLIGFRADSDARYQSAAALAPFCIRNVRSLVWASLFWLVVLILWQLNQHALKKYFRLGSPGEIIDALERQFFPGIAIHESMATILPDIGRSLAEIAGGAAVAALFALLFVELVCRELNFSRPLRWLSLASVAPVVLIAPAATWFGIGLLHKVAAIAFVTFYPLARGLAVNQSFRLSLRLLLAIDAALPYAFIGMVFSELYAATSGLGFFVIVARANYRFADAAAGALVAFGLFVLASATIQFAAKRLDSPLAVQGNRFPTAAV